MAAPMRANWREVSAAEGHGPDPPPGVRSFQFFRCSCGGFHVRKYAVTGRTRTRDPNEKTVSAGGKQSLRLLDRGDDLPGRHSNVVVAFSEETDEFVQVRKCRRQSRIASLLVRDPSSFELGEHLPRLVGGHR